MKIKNVITWLFLIGILITVISQKTLNHKKEIEKTQTEKVTKRTTPEIKKTKLAT